MEAEETREVWNNHDIGALYSLPTSQNVEIRIDRSRFVGG